MAPKSTAAVINKLSALVVVLLPDETMLAEPASVMAPFNVDTCPKFLMVPKLLNPSPIILKGSLIV